MYMNDLILSGNNSTTLLDLKKIFVFMFLYERSWGIKVFSRHRLARNPKGIFQCQRKYTLDIMLKFGNLSSKLVLFLVEPKRRLAKIARFWEMLSTIVSWLAFNLFVVHAT